MVQKLIFVSNEDIMLLIFAAIGHTLHAQTVLENFNVRDGNQKPKTGLFSCVITRVVKERFYCFVAWGRLSIDTMQCTNVGQEAAYLSKQGLILSKLSDLREAHGVELAELPLDEPGPGPRPISDPWL